MTTPDDPRPAPLYGEYATPEQQRAAIRLPLPEPDPGARVRVEPAPAPRRARGSRADRIITIALLAYGLVTVLAAIPQLLDFTAFMDAWIEVAGVDAEFTNIEQGSRWGLIAAAVFVVGWGLTAAASVVMLRRGRAAWWIPLAGAIVTFLVASVCLTVPVLGDPAIMEHFARTGR